MYKLDTLTIRVYFPNDIIQFRGLQRVSQELYDNTNHLCSQHAFLLVVERRERIFQHWNK